MIEKALPPSGKIKNTMPNRALDYQLIEQAQGLDAFYQEHKKLSWMAFDTEFVGEKRFFTRLCLIQVKSEKGLFLIDPIRLGRLDPFLDLITDRKVTKITHAGDNDYRLLNNLFGIVPSNVFDTQIAAVLCGYEMPPSYQKLVQAELGIALEKHATRTDWLKRPLDDEQLRYAAEDVEHLHPLFERLDRQLRELGRRQWLDEDCARAVARARAPGDPYPHLKVRAIERMSAAQQQRLWRLLMWRDAEAMQRNRPKRWILDNPVAIRAALLECPSRSDLEAAVAADGKPSPRLAQKLETILHAEASAEELAIPLQSLLTEAEKARAKTLRETVVKEAERLGISADSLLPRRALEHWARRDQLPDDLRGWRDGVLGL